MADLIIDANSLFARAYYAAETSAALQGAGTPEKPLGASIASLKITLSLLNHRSGHLPEAVSRVLFC